MKNLITVAMLTLLFYGCVKEDSLSHSGTKQSMNRSDTAVDNQRPGIDGEWLVVRSEDISEIPDDYTWYQYDSEFHLIKCNYVAPPPEESYDVTLTWNSGNLRKIEDNLGTWYFNYDEQNRLSNNIWISNTGQPYNPHSFQWNDAMDTVLVQYTVYNQYTHILDDRGNIIKMLKPDGTVYFDIEYHIGYPWPDPLKASEPIGSIPGYGADMYHYRSTTPDTHFSIDSVVDNRIYEYTFENSNGVHRVYKVDWEFFTYNAR